MSSTSIQHRMRRTQPQYQLSRANLPHEPRYMSTSDPKRIRKNKVAQKKRRVNIKFKKEFIYVNRIYRGSTVVYNWRLIKPKRLGYIIVNSWSNDGKEEHNSNRCTWGYSDPNSGFIYVGNRTESYKLGLSSQYYNSKFAYQKPIDIENLLIQLDNPLV